MADKVKLIAEFEDRMSGPMKSAGDNSVKFGKVLAGAGAAAIAVGVAILALAKKMGDLAAKARDTAADLGVTTDDVQALNYAFEQTGGSADTFQNSMRGVTTFMRTAATGAAEQTAILDKLGITYEQLAAMEPYKQFEYLTDAIGGMTAGTDRATTAATIFGSRYSQQLIGTLEQAGGSLRGLSQAFRDSDMMIPAEDIARLAEFSDKWTDLEKKIQSLLAEAIMPMLPVIEDMADEFIEVAADAIPQLIQAAEAAIPILMGMVDAAVLVADGWSRISGGDVKTEVDATADAFRMLAESLEGQVAAGMMTATEAAIAYQKESDALIKGFSDNVIEQEILRGKTEELGISFNLARTALEELLGVMDYSGVMSDIGSTFEATGENILNMLVDMDALTEAVITLSTTPITPPGTLTDEDAEETLEKLNTFKDRQIANLEEIHAMEEDAAAQREEDEQTSAGNRLASIIREKTARLKAEMEIETERVRIEERVGAIAYSGANEMGRILINKGEDWETQMLTAIGKMILKMAAIKIGGPLGGIFGFIGGLFQQGTPSIPHAQDGWQTPTGLYGDRFPVMVEGGEGIISREQRIMNNNYNTSSSSINLNVVYQPTFSTASPGEAVKLTNELIPLLQQAGVNI